MITVSISCLAYNHEKHIKKCLDGFLMQKTNFNIEVIIHDDASTDGTQDIIKEYENKYPEIIFPIYQSENQWSKGKKPTWEFNAPRWKGKYIAICEGDDYWTDPLKLQKQVDFMEVNSDYGLVHTQYSKIRVTEGIFRHSSIDRSQTSFEDLLIKNCIITATTCFRKSLIVKYIKDIQPSDKKNWVAGDTPMWLWFSIFSKIHFMKERTVVNHIISGSASNTSSSRQHYNFVKSRLSIKKYFIDKYNGSQKALKFIYDDFYRESEYHAIKLKEIKIIRENIKNLRSRGLIIKPYYLQLMCNVHLQDNIYKTLFFFYKIYNRLK